MGDEPRPRHDWQDNKTVLECNRYMYENQVACDIKFKVGTEDGAIEIPAHKYMLISRSPVFFSMFCGDLQETVESVRVIDVEPQVFRHMLRFIYCEEVDFEADDALPVLYAAKKYMIQGLVEKCKSYLENNMDPNNVCVILSHSMLFDEEDLIAKCNTFIESHTGEVFENASFMEISHSTLVNILKLTKMNVTELNVFRACMKWAEGKCKKNDLEITVENKRQVLGDALFLIHFPAMPLKEFANNIARRGILTAEEKCSIFEYLTCEVESPTPPEMKFPVFRRQNSQPCICRRFMRFTKCNVFNGDYGVIKMQCNKTIMIKGFGVSGSINYDPLNEVQIVIKEEGLLVYNRVTTVYDDRTGEPIMVRVHEDVIFQPGVWYTIKVTFHFYGEDNQGCCRWGKGGCKTQSCDGVVFEFDRCESGAYVPEILFCLI